MNLTPSRIALALLFAVGCDATPGPHGRNTYPGVDWEVSTPEREGLDASALEALRAYAMDDTDRFTQAVIVVKNGVIVGEWYGPDGDATTQSTSWSMGKSFGSTLIGIAIDRGEIPSVNTALSTWFPSWQGTPNAAITLKDLLEMRSGLPWDVTGYSDIDLAFTNGDQLAYSLGRTLAYTPGTVWHYSSGDSMIMSGVLEAATGREAGAYATEHLFEPIGMHPTWWHDAAGHALTYCCIDAVPRDYARFGLLAARGGVWKGKQIVSQAWLDEATTPIPEYPVYGYQWWILPGTFTVDGESTRVFYADGKDTQRIYVVPSLDLVIVRSGKYVHLGSGYVLSQNGNFILTTPPATWSDTDFMQLAFESIDPTATYAP